jgi:hypothetical protein
MPFDLSITQYFVVAIIGLYGILGIYNLLTGLIALKRGDRLGRSIREAKSQARRERELDKR